MGGQRNVDGGAGARVVQCRMIGYLTRPVAEPN